MKTTVELTDKLVRSAKPLAIERGTTLRQLVENGLQREIREPIPPEVSHPLRKIASLEKSLWDVSPADAYVQRERAEW